MEIDVKQVQQREVEILRQIMDLCRRYNIRCWADGGTLIGAVRHGGFIPWDDDVDLTMPREDFDRFRTVAKKELPDWLVLQDYECIHHCFHPILKVHDRRTTFVEAPFVPYPEAYTGVYIDIFCADGYPDDEQERQTLDRRMKRLSVLSGFLRAQWRDTRTFGQKLRYCLGAPLRWCLPYNWATQKQEELLRRYPFGGTELINSSQGWLIHPAWWVRDTVQMPFEDVMLPCPVGYDEYLTCMYGDYMQPPPEAERVPQHTVAYFSMDKSYREEWWKEE